MFAPDAVGTADQILEQRTADPVVAQVSELPREVGTWSMSANPPLHLAIDLDGDGAHPAAWRVSGRAPAAVFDPNSLRRVVAAAEAAGFTFATFDDSPLPPNADGGLDAAGRLESGTRAAFVATLTNRLGLAPTLHPTTTEPFHLATQLASLDYASRGRAAWVVGVADDADSRATIGLDALAPDALRREVADVITVARLLWDSWQDDAVIKDVVTGRYLDPDRVHHVDFEGASFTVKGPLITPRPPQGQVVVITPSHLDVDNRADIVLIAEPDIAAVRTRADRARAAGAPLTFVDLEVLLDTPEQPAKNRAERLDEATPWPATGRLRHVGSAADLLQLLNILGDVVDGVRFLPAVQSIDLPLLVEQVLPGLAVAGLHLPPEPGATLRESLGLSRPANQFAVTGV
jgi:alkanesulfonate monooxygenase SsuD/methylene tetrahydromethanopterin reductase-like flavin-dependent oxidoreductase (luciferase family)